MTERAYTVSEIDRMRKAVGMKNAYKPLHSESANEDQLRTYMLAGVSIEDLEREAEAECDRDRLAARREMNASQEFYQKHDSMGRKLG